MGAGVKTRYCPTCRSNDHHRRDCPEMSFPSGRRRDDPGSMPSLRACKPDRVLPLHQEGPIAEEMAGIFRGVSEGAIAAYVTENRRAHG